MEASDDAVVPVSLRPCSQAMREKDMVMAELLYSTPTDPDSQGQHRENYSVNGTA